MTEISTCQTSASTSAPNVSPSTSSSLTENHPKRPSSRPNSYSSGSSVMLKLQQRPCSRHRQLPDVLIDFIALKMYDLLPTKQQPFGQRTVPELLYFIKHVTTQARISCHIAVVALIYIERCKQRLPQHAVGDEDTAHRIFVASILVASKFLHGTAWASSQQQSEDDDTETPAESRSLWLTNARIASICAIYSVREINQLECSFLNLIHHRCWVDSSDVQSYLVRHRQDLLL